MVQINKIQNSLIGLVGYQQPYNPDYAIVDIDNLASESGYFVTDNPYAKIDFIKDNQDYISISDTDFNLFLKDLKKRSISNVCNAVFSDFDFIDRSVLYKNASNKIETETLPDGFIGYKVKVSGDKDLAFKLNRVLLDFEGTGSIDLLIFNSSKKTPIFSKTINITTDHQSEPLEWVLDNSADTYKGEYYLGYTTNGVVPKPYKRSWNSSSILSNPKMLCFEKIFVKGHNTATLFDLSLIDGLSEDTGLNFDVTVYDDYTDFVINNKMLFARAIQLSCIISSIQIYISTLRSNGNEVHSASLYQKIMVELEGTSSDSAIKIKGLKAQLLSEITSIKDEIKKIKQGKLKSGFITVTPLR